MKICEWCEEEIEHPRSGQRYCSDPCRKKGWEKQTALKRIALEAMKLLPEPERREVYRRTEEAHSPGTRGRLHVRFGARNVRNR